MKTILINIGGITVEAEPMNHEAVEEPWSSYHLNDGSTIRIKFIVSDIFKLATPDPVTGFPQYVVKSNNVISVEALDRSSPLDVPAIESPIDDDIPVAEPMPDVPRPMMKRKYDS